MNKPLKSENIKTILMFLAMSVLIVYFLPSQVSFKYSYQKGHPWQGEALIAPFDFAIHKTESEIKTERDSALQSFFPYFVFDFTITNNEIYKFKSSFDSLFHIALKKACSNSDKSVVTDQLKQTIYNEAKTLLNFVYNKGIADFNNQQTSKAIDNKNAIVILKNNIAKNITLEEVFTEKTAYDYIAKRVEKIKQKNTTKAKILNELKLYDFLEQNLFYDIKKTEKAKQSIIDNLSVTRGMVQAGERIISKGDLVHNDNFIVIESLKKEYNSYLGLNVNKYWVLVGQALIVLIIMFVLYMFLLNFHGEIVRSSRKTLFILIMMSIIFICSSLLQRYSSFNLYLIPFVMIIIVLYSFFSVQITFFVYTATVMLCAFLANNPFEFLFLQITAGAISIYSLRNIYRRSQLFIAVGLAILSYVITYTAMVIIREGSFTIDNPYHYAYFAVNGLLLLTSYPLIFLFEKLFGFISDATLLELSDTNNKALRQLAENAPGTFQHVMQVANLSEEAIRKIGGNTLLMRTGALYHDIGKIGAPAFFVENQAGGVNPHDKLSNEESAEVIINHVIYGLELAKKYNLPKVVTDFIATHHGTSVVRYFYTQQVNAVGQENVDISKYTYPGPNPFSKETAVLMMADAIEAASRSMPEYSQTSIDKLVENIIDLQIADGQFTDADITFKDISEIKEVFKQKLTNIYHSRIAYPEMKKTPETGKINKKRKKSIK